MELERMNLVLRQRSPWEAVDLGMALARRHYAALLVGWLLTATPTAVVLGILLRDHMEWAYLGLWWFKPLYERVPLVIVSRAVFGDPTGAHPRAWPALLTGALRRGTRLVGALTWRRFSPWRSYHSPVDQLEDTPRRSDRIAALGASTGSAWAASCLSWFGLCAEVGLLLTPSLLYAALVPNATEPTLPSGLLSLGLLWGAMACVAPWYVAGGFALYISCRVEREAWDLELVFRQLLLRKQGRRLNRAVAASVLCLLAGTAGAQNAETPDPEASNTPALSRHATAFEPPGTKEAHAQPSKSDAKRMIEDVLSHPDFSHERTRNLWLPRKRPKQPEDSLLDSEAARLLRRILAELWLLALIVLGLVALVAVLRFAMRRTAQRPRVQPHTDDPTPPTAVGGLDVRPESLPRDLIGRVLADWRAGETRAALSLLYRGALSHLVHTRGLAISPSATESECLALVRGLNDPELLSDVKAVVQNWQRTAYALRPPGTETLVELCRRWRARLDQAEAQP